MGDPCVSDATDLSGLKILVVDDDADNLEMLSFALAIHGAAVTPFLSAITALEVYPQLQPDILISDIGMPEIDGYAFLQQVKTNNSGIGRPILAIALTAHVGELSQQQALAAGFQKHVCKPVEPDKLVQEIARLIGRM